MRNWKMLVAGTVCAIAAVAVYAQQKPDDGVRPLTAEDRLEILELMYRYMFVLDSCDSHNNGYAYADLYTPDGQFGTGNLKGRDALARAAGRTSDGKCSPIRLRGSMNQLHVNLGHMMKPTREGAKSISYLLMVDGPAHEIYWNGWYQDLLVKTGQGWRFKSRHHLGGAAVGVPADLAAARMLWERQPTPAGSRSLIGKGPAATGAATIAGDPLRWFDEP